MKFHEHLHPESILVDLQSRQRDDAIAELAGRLEHHAAMGSFPEFVKAVLKREADGTTGIGEGIAIPHARTDSVRDFVAAVGLSKSGIDFGAIDGRLVHVVLLMGIPLAQVKPYLKLLAHLRLLLRQGDFCKSLLDASDARGVLEVFASYEE